VIWDFGGCSPPRLSEAFCAFETERCLPADIIRRTNAQHSIWQMPGRIDAREVDG